MYFYVVLARYRIAIVRRPSVRPSVCLSVTLMYRGRMCWVSSKLLRPTRIISLGSSLLGNLVQGEDTQNSGGIGVGLLSSAENLQYLCNGARYDQGCY